MRRLASILAVALLALALAAVALAAKKPPATGDYRADLDVNGTYQQGGWTVVKEGGKRLMVASGQYNGIYYPDPGECDNYSLPLKAGSIPISKAGKFHVRDTNVPVGTSVEIEVDWKGKWKSATKLVGTVKIASGNCSSTNEFTGEKIRGG